MNKNLLLASNPIPLQWYANDSLAIAEVKELENHPFYLGSKFAIPAKGDYLVSEPTFKNFALIHGENGIKAVSNICRHRQSILLKGYGSAKKITCPIHYWKYALDGTGLTAHDFNKDYQCPDLPTMVMSAWGPLLFKQNSSLNGILDRAVSLKKHLTTDYLFRSLEVLECPYNWKIFMEIYLDLYHINIIHPGLRKFASCENTQWETDDFFSSQTVEVILDPSNNPSPHYKEYSHLIIDYAGRTQKHKIIWFSLYPNTMVEIYPYNMVISSIIPLSSSNSLNVVEFYMDATLKDYKHGQALHEAFKQAYLETAKEDDSACFQIQLGRNALYANNIEDHGPAHDPLEAGIPCFYEFWNQHFNPARNHP